MITHIGVSALSCEALRNVQSQNYDLIAEELALGSERPEALEIAQRDLLRGLGRTWERSMQPRQRRTMSPAEIAAVSLLLTERMPDDTPPLPITRLVLLSSETRGGEFCARLLEQAFVAPEDVIPQKPGYPHMAHDQLHAGTDSGTVAGLPKRSHAYLFEYQASQRLQRSPIGEVVWTRYTLLYPGGRSLCEHKAPCPLGWPVRAPVH